MVAADPSRVAVLHTLGPTGTNCEAAAHAWFRRQGGVGRVELHSTLEQAVERIGWARSCAMKLHSENLAPDPTRINSGTLFA